jgi:long-chain acyl-CoA synthetase
LLIAMMQHPGFDEIDFSTVFGVIAGGAPLVEEIGDEWYRRTGSKIYEGYGLSETAASGAVNNMMHRRLGTVGKTMVSTEIKVVDEHGNRLGKGEEGELLIRGPQVMQGYWQRPEETAEAFDDEGWFRTGDVGVIDDEGYIRIVDRIKDMILVSGFNVYPAEIENILYRHPDVLECAVVGVPSERSGEAVKVFMISSNADLREDEIRDFCRENLTAYKVPRHVEFVTELPKSSVGKILRRELRG